MADQEQFEQLLINLTSADNQLRKSCEEQYHAAAASSPAWVVMALVEVGCRGSNAAAANMALVMLRKLLARKSNAFDQCDESSQSHVKASLIELFGTTEDRLLRRAAASCISNLAVKLSSDGQNAWPELWDLLMSTLQNVEASEEIRANCCLIFSQTATFLAGAYLRGHLDVIMNAMLSNLNCGHEALAKEAAGALVELLQTSDAQDVPAIARSPIFSSMIDSAGTYIQKDMPEVAEEIIQGLSSVTEKRVQIAIPHTQQILTAMSAIASNPALEKDLRHSAIDLVLTLGEADESILKKQKTFASDFFNLMAQYTTRPQMEDDWETTYDASNEADGSDFEAGASAMDRLSRILKGKQVQELATNHIMANINNEAWENRAAALTVLTYVAEGCQKQFRKHLDMIVDQIIIPRMTDPHPMVRYCAMQCIAQMSSDFSPYFQETYAQKVLAALCDALMDAVPRLRAMAASTMNQFFDELEEDDEEDFEEDEWEQRMSDYHSMMPYMNSVAQALGPALQQCNYNFQRLAMLGCAAAVISVAGKILSPFVDAFVPIFQEMLALPENQDNHEAQLEVRKIKCNAIECTTLLASHVGAEAFANYSHSVCLYLLGLMNEGLDSDDIRLRYILRGWTCMVECLKTDVLQYMDQVVPSLLFVANVECDAEVAEAEVGDDDEQNNHKDAKVQIVRVRDKEGTKTVKLHTGLIEDKDLAITILMVITQELKGQMQPYANEVTNTAVKLLGFNAYPDIRDTAAETLAALSITIKEADPANSAAFVQYVYPPLLEALEQEPELHVARQMIETMGLLVENAPVGSAAGEMVRRATEILKEVFIESLDELEEFLTEHATQAAEDSDDETAEELAAAAKAQDFLLTEVAETVGKLVKTSPDFLEPFDQIFLPLVARLLDKSKPGTYHRLGLCILCDFMEFAPTAAAQHLETIAQAMANFAESEDSEVVQAAMYGGGICGEVIARVVAQPNQDSNIFAQTMCQRAVQFLLTPPSRSDEGLSCATNAVSCILRLIECFPTAIDIPAAMRTVISHLPCRDDRDEEIRIIDTLVRWASDSSNPVMADASIRNQILFAIKRGKNMSDEARAALASM